MSQWMMYVSVNSAFHHSSTRGSDVPLRNPNLHPLPLLDLSDWIFGNYNSTQTLIKATFRADNSTPIKR